MAASFVPVLTGAYYRDDMEAVRGQINLSTRFIMVVAFPCAVGLAVFGLPIFNILFSSTRATNAEASLMMYVGAVAVVFYSLSTLSNGLLQGIDRLKVPVINAAISIVAHVIVLILLMLIFRLNIHAVVLANTFFALLMCFMNSMALKKYSGFNQEIKRTFIIPAISSLIMGVISYIVYFILYKACHIEIIAFILAAIIAVISYAVALLLLKGLTEDELRHFPKGTLIIKVAKKCHLL